LIAKRHLDLYIMSESDEEVRKLNFLCSVSIISLINIIMLKTCLYKESKFSFMSTDINYRFKYYFIAHKICKLSNPHVIKKLLCIEF